MEAKDKTLLEQETQMLALTDQVDAHQKLEEGLKKQISDFKESELEMERKKGELLEKMREKDANIESLESLKSQADEENLKLQEILEEADN